LTFEELVILHEQNIDVVNVCMTIW